MKKSLFTLFLILFCNCVYAQKKRLKNPEKKTTDWEVVANRTNIPVYQDKRLKTQVAGITLKFKTEYYVVGIHKSGKQIIAVQIEHGKNPIKHYWVNANDLLLSNRCLRTNDISIKATVVNYITDKNPKSEYFDAPDTTSKRLGEARWYHIYYVYDTYPKSARDNPEDAEYLFLGTDYSFNPAITQENASNTLLGWFRKKRDQNLVIWNTRIGLQPNLSLPSKKEKLKQNVFASIWTNIPDAQRWYGGYSPSRSLVSNDSIQVKKNYQYQIIDYRMPVIKRLDDRPGEPVYEVAYAGNRIFDQRKIQMDVKDILNKRNVSVLYVVDATKTMCNYLKTLPKAIEEASAQISKEFPSYKFTWGLAVFRNKDDLTKDKYQFLGKAKNVDQLKKMVSKVNCFSNSKDFPEDIFRGSQQAIGQFFNNADDGLKMTFAISDVYGTETKSFNPNRLGETLRSVESHFLAMNLGELGETKFKSQIEQLAQSMNRHKLSFSEIKDRYGKLSYYSVDYLRTGNKSDRMAAYIKVKKKSSYKSIMHDFLYQAIFALNGSINREIYGGELEVIQNQISERSSFTFPMNFNAEFERNQLSNDQVGVFYSKGFVINSHKKLNELPFEPMVMLSADECFGLTRVTEGIIRIIENPDGGEADVFAQVRDLFAQYAGEEQMFTNLDELDGLGYQLPILSQVIADFRKDGVNFLLKRDSDELEALRLQLLVKKEKIKAIFQELINQEGFLVGTKYHRWVKLSDLP